MIIDGEQWERLADVPRLLGSRPAATIRAWARSGRVRAIRLGSGGHREVYVAIADILAADAATPRRRGRRRRVT